MNLETLALPLAIAIGILTYLIIVLFLPKKLLTDNNAHIKAAMQRLEVQQRPGVDENSGIAKRRKDFVDSLPVRAFLFLPGASSSLPYIEQAGLLAALDKLIIGSTILFLALITLTFPMGAIGIALSVTGTLLAAILFVRYKRKKRRREFLNAFPDALDIIVRSVRAGYPINAAISTVGDTMKSWVGEEFQRIVDEASYGWTLSEAINRFADRIDEPDAQFFAVVLTVQQESGGNLSEILSNLSRIIRERKHLRLKIHALSSEGRATAWILLLLPCFMLAMVYFYSPGHLNPLWETGRGLKVLIGVACAIALGITMMRKIINIRI